MALLEQFRFADAVAAFSRAHAADPSLVAAQVNLAIASLYVPDVPAAKRAAEEALRAAPDAPHPNYILALIARTEGRAEEALPYLEKVLAKDPKDLGANVTLGQVYLQMRRFDDAAAAFRLALASEPYNVSAAYNLGVALTRGGQRAEGQQAMARFQQLRDSQYKSALGSNYLDQGKYAEAVASTGAESEAVDARTPAVSFVETDGALPAAHPDAAKALAQAAVVLADLDGDGLLDAVEAGAPSLRVLKGSAGRFQDVTAPAGLEGTAALAAVAADYDNDGRPDLLVIRPARTLALFRNEGEGRFKDVTVPAGLAASRVGGTAETASAAFVDVDHDGDLDIFAPGLVLQNNGNGTFTDITAKAGLSGSADAIAVLSTDFDNRRDVDLFALREGSPALYKNMRDGSFRDVAAETGLAAAMGPFRCVAKADLNKDGYDGLLPGRSRGVVLRAQRRARRVRGEAGAARRGWRPRGAARGLRQRRPASTCSWPLRRGRGSFATSERHWADVSSAAFGEDLRAAPLAGAALAIADLDRDGDEDALVATPSRLRLLQNQDGNRNRSFAVGLKGRVSSRDGVGAKVEIRAGSLRQKFETTAAVPMAAPADVVFGLGARERRRRGAGALGRPASCRPRRTSSARATSPARSRSSGARPQTLLLSLPLRLERGALRVRHRLPGRGRDGLWRRSGSLERSGPRRVRADRAPTGSDRATDATSCASRTSSRRCSTSTACSSWRSTTRRTCSSSRTRA